jgi:DNA modification methylase/DNA-binding XRE family transcriptional regulator
MDQCFFKHASPQHYMAQRLTKMVNGGILISMRNTNTKQAPAYSSVVETFGRRLRIERTAAGLSLITLAAKLKVTKGYLSRLESDKAIPSLQMVERIAKAFGTDPDPLYILAGYLPTDVKQILYQHPVEAPTVLRDAFNEYQTDTSSLLMQRAEKSPPLGKSNWKDLYEIVQADCFDWLDQRKPDTIHAVVTDPPYGLKEYTLEEKTKLRRGRGGVWRIPPSFDGCTRSPLPRFTILTDEDKTALQDFIAQWSSKIFRVLVPGGHVFIAANPLVSHLVYLALEKAGFEKRGEIIRLVQTLRGGDRPKNAHKEFSDVTVMPRSNWEPWGLFRKPCEGRVQDNLRKWKTGGLRRISEEQPFGDVIKSAPTRSVERDIAPHPSLKPQAFMRQIVRAALPLGEGIVLDPFMGGGSTIAAACAVGYRSIGVESDPEFYQMAVQAIPQLATLALNGTGNGLSPHFLKELVYQQSLFEP